MRYTFDRHNWWGWSLTRLGNNSVLRALKVNRILVIGPFAIGWWNKAQK